MTLLGQPGAEAVNHRDNAASVLPKQLATGFIVLVSTIGLSACTDTNFSAQTNQQYQAAEGANKRSNDVSSMNTVVVVDKSGKGVISAALVNKSDDKHTLRAITATSDVGEQLAVTGPAASTVIAADDLVTLGSTAQNRVVVDGVTAGKYVTLTFSFDSAPVVVVEAPVVQRNAMYESVVGAQ